MPVPTGAMSETGSENATDGAMPSSSNTTIVPNPTDLGKRVVAFSAQGRKEQYYGTLRFCGKPEFAEGVWCGIELDDPDGKNNGSVQGIRYFSCEAGYGVFVPLSRVELDMTRRSRVRPKTKPNSRPSSRDRGDHKPGSTSIPSSPAKTRSSNVPREMVMKLSTPGTLDRYQYRKKSSLQPAGKPMKAVGTEYGSYGLKKCTSEMNIRGQLADSTNGTNQPPRFLRPQHKRGSMGDLKSAASLSGPPSPAHGRDAWEGAGLRGANSCGNLAFPKQTTTEVKVSPPTGKKQSRDPHRHHSHSEMMWPRTSSPTSSDQQDMDCFEDTSSDSDRTPHSSSASPTSPRDLDFSSNMFGTSGGIGTPFYNQAFLTTPGNSFAIKDLKYGSCVPSNPHAQSLTSRHIPVPQGLVTQAIQLIEKSRKDSSDGPCRVPSPESQKTSGKRYRNRRSGTATLAHPLTSTHGNDRSSPDSSSSSNTSVGDPSEIFVCPTSGQQIPVSVGSTTMNGAQEVWYQQLNRRQVMLEERLLSMEVLLKQTKADLQAQKEFFLKQMEEAQDKFKKQMEDAQSKHRTEIRQLCMALLNHSE